MNTNKTVRKENYGRGMKYGREVYCGQDLRDFIGMTIRDVNSDDMDCNVMMWLEGDERSVTLCFDDSCFDGERIKIVENPDADPQMLRPVVEKDLKEIYEMQGYYDNDVFDENNDKIGVNHVYCNDISLDGTEKFKIKCLYVFTDGRIMTPKEV